MSLGHVAIDFETFYSKKLKYGLRTQIAEEYCRDELFDAYLVSASDGVNCWSGHPSEFNWYSIDGKVLVSHNRYFDNTVFNEMKRRCLIPSYIQPAAWHCTANLTSYLCNRRALDDAIEFLYGAKVDKSYRDIADGKHWPGDYTEEEQEFVKKAGRVDAQWCWRLWQDFSDKWPEMEKKVSNITIDQGMRGVQIDVELLKNYIIIIHDALLKTKSLIPWMQEDPEEEEDWDEFNCKPTATKCIAEQCRRKGIPCPPTKSEDEEGYEEWETLYSPVHPWIKAVSAYRSINKLYATFCTVKRRLRDDGTLPFALKYFGAHTGRWSGDAKVNFQNMRKKPLFVTLEGFMEQNEKRIADAMAQKDREGKYPEWVKHAIDFRALIIPRPGCRMVACDLSQIEPRVLAHLGGNKELLRLIKEGYGVYEAFARTSMKYDGPKFTPEVKRSDFYKMIKIQVLGLGYGAGWEKFISIAWNEGGIDLTKDDPEFATQVDPFTKAEKQVPGYGTTSKGIVAKFREAAPHITGMWRKMEDGLRRSVGVDFVATLPSGRRMTYRKVICAATITKDPETGKPKREVKYTADVGKRKIFYGGKLTENVVQAVARDVFAWQLVNMVERGWRVLFSVHDEAVLELEDAGICAKDIESEMSRCPEWLEGCPIAAEAKELSHYEK